jgi:hypothetical protein
MQDTPLLNPKLTTTEPYQHEDERLGGIRPSVSRDIIKCLQLCSKADRNVIKLFLEYRPVAAPMHGAPARHIEVSAIFLGRAQ